MLKLLDEKTDVEGLHPSFWLSWNFCFIQMKLFILLHRS
ncbi:hypothetical protein PARMER_02392 [Parabacteroides merdae ATCC 43184]|nr:hypothetical protein PARMER_02392 [Parabacteroides merdae ATCC 43184]